MALSPMMQQYVQTKEQYKDCVLLYRLGDFYEMFFDDAIEVSRVLGLTLTGRDCGLAERAPMCGIPYHALDSYAPKLIEMGYKVAICEQLTLPDKKGLVKRDVVRVMTPGTVMDSSMLDENKFNYIACVFLSGDTVGISWADITTGDMFASELKADAYNKELQDVLARISPAEIISNMAMFESSAFLPCVKLQSVPKFTMYNESSFDLIRAKKVVINQIGEEAFAAVQKYKCAISACGALLEYLSDTQKRALSHINRIEYLSNSRYMSIDASARRNLELTQTMQDGKRRGSLLGVLDMTKTNMGTRNLTSWIEEPLQDIREINLRLDAVAEIKMNLLLQNDLKESLSRIRDIERLIGKISYNSMTPRDMEMLCKSIETFPRVTNALSKCQSKLILECRDSIIGLDCVYELLDRAIVEDAPLVLKDGGYIKNGYNAELDELLEIKANGAAWISMLENDERERTGIKNLRIHYNKVFGYYIEVTKSYQELVPYTYIRKQTLANCERYITNELKDMEDKILHATDNIIRLESKLFSEVREFLMKYVNKLQRAGRAIATVDTVLSLAMVANKYNYTRPKLLKKSEHISIKDGRHPVVEALLKGEQFVANDTYLNNSDSKAMLITGPNMAGKSTYMRQVAIITLMAHIGSFVPASFAEISLTDKIFTRVGASDNLAFSQSTFMVEMSEVANILNNATDDSLIILDEVGRGTSTYDGMSIAWAVMEYLTKRTKAKVLFATHYHELIELEDILDGVKNYQVLIKEFADSIIFLRKIVRGGADKSFGIEVAKLAGVPKEVLDSASVILKNIHSTINLEEKPEVEAAKESVNPKYRQVINILKDLDINNCTPLVAFDTLNDLVNKVKNV